MDDFVPWVASISGLLPAHEAEEEEDEMANLVHNFGVRKHKRGVSFKRVADAAPDVIGDVGQLPASKAPNM